MDVSSPFSAILPGVDSFVIRSLAETDLPRTGREIARAAERSHPAVQKVLTRLVEQGVVHERPAGRARVYVLNRDHVAAPAFESLSSLRMELFRRIGSAIAAWHLKPVHASVFGSAARGDGDSSSDVDLFIVKPADVDFDGKEWQSQIHDLSEAILLWSGNHAGMSIVDERNLASMKSGESPVARDIASEGFHLHGARIRKLLGEISR